MPHPVPVPVGEAVRPMNRLRFLWWGLVLAVRETGPSAKQGPRTCLSVSWPVARRASAGLFLRRLRWSWTPSGKRKVCPEACMLEFMLSLCHGPLLETVSSLLQPRHTTGSILLLRTFILIFWKELSLRWSTGGEHCGFLLHDVGLFDEMISFVKHNCVVNYGQRVVVFPL